MNFLNKKNVNLPHNSVDISITTTIVMAAIPDTALLAHFINKTKDHSLEFGKLRSIFNLRQFLRIQLLLSFKRIGR